jgi:hypothetical protein
MRKLATALLIGTLGLCLQPALAADAKRPNAQQEKMAACNAEAGQQKLKGPNRQNFMRECLSARQPPAGSVNRQQDKMKECNAEAATQKLQAEARKAFMQQCLSGPANRPAH